MCVCNVFHYIWTNYTLEYYNTTLGFENTGVSFVSCFFPIERKKTGNT